MDATYILYLGRHTLETALLISSPLLLACMLSGLVISLIQTVTSIRDMTMTIVPKLLVLGVTALFFGSWMMQVLIRFATEIFNQIQAYGN